MRIGFDIDGISADFIPAYEEMFVRTTGRNDFPPVDPVNSVPEWNWPTRYGYTAAETKAVWAVINKDSHFWQRLNTTPEFATFSRWFYDQDVRDHEIYFVTSRPGLNPKLQTEDWFYRHLNCPVTVLISDSKGAVCKALNLDFYLDDKLENILDVQQTSPNTRAYLLDRAYNRDQEVTHRISTVAEFLSTVNASKLSAVA